MGEKAAERKPLGGLDQALVEAVSAYELEAVKRILEAGADPDCAGKGGRRPLHEAASRGFSEAAQLLLNFGADPNAEDDRGYSPLWSAAARLCEDTMRALVRGGAKAHPGVIEGPEGCCDPAYLSWRCPIEEAAATAAFEDGASGERDVFEFWKELEALEEEFGLRQATGESPEAKRSRRPSSL